MNTIQNQPTTNISSNTASSSTNTNSMSTDAMSSNFLKMLVTQLQYQDPTNPVSSAEMTSQLAQISTVQGIGDLNKTMSSMVESSKTSQLYQSSNLIGRTVATTGNNMSLLQGKAQFGINLGSAADSVSVTVLNSMGQTVNTMNFSNQPAGVMPVIWNGQTMNGTKAPDGEYSFKVSAISSGQPISATGLTYNTVAGVQSTSTGTMLNMTNNKSFDASTVTQIL